MTKRWPIALALMTSASLAAAQTPTKRPASPAPAAPAIASRPSAPGDVETDPIKCWWKTDRSAVIVGERFTLTLTCGVIETARVKVVPDVAQLEPTVLPISPFEVVRGITHEDVSSPPWRYFQREYTARLVADAFFDKDVDIPPVKVIYRIQSAIGGGTQGRDQTYVLPAMPIHIASLVPKKGNDIRDASHDTFATIETRRQRATQKTVGAFIAFGFAVVFIGLAVVRVAGRYRVRTPAVARPLPTRGVLAGCTRALGSVSRDVARDGWTPELAGRALTALRIAGAVALGHPVAQAIVDTSVQPREGQIGLRKGLIRRRTALVSTSVTPGTIAKALEAGTPAAARHGAVLKDLQDALRVFSTARYARDAGPEPAALERALETGTDAARRLRWATLWPVRTPGSNGKSTSDLEGVAWSR